MPDSHPITDEAVRYVLGELDGTERRAFEVQLDKSADLRAQVRELEEGAVALALAAPRRRPPAQAWQQIEKALARETKLAKVVPAWWTGWWRSGWAAAACLLIGLCYALWANRSDPARLTPPSADLTVRSQRSVEPAESLRTEQAQAISRTTAASNLMFTQLQTRTQEMSALRRQVIVLQGRLAQMSQSLAQQQALLSETNRLKFFQLTPVAGNNTDPNAPSLSPRLQQALFLAMARELGWQSPANTSPDNSGGNATETAGTNQAGVDFVDLRPASKSTASPTPEPQIPTQPTGASEPPSLASGSTNTVPGFMSGDSAFLALDSTLAPLGTSVTFWTTTGLGGDGSGYIPLGTVALQNNPLVVAMHASFSSGSTLVVTATAPDGTITTIGQAYYPPMLNPPQSP